MGQVVTLRQRKVPTIENGKVPPVRRSNKAVRTREYLTSVEVDQLMKAARDNARRYGHRDATAILVAYRHALRVSELLDLRWSDVDFKAARLNVRRLKGSISGVHPIEGDELRALRALLKLQGDTPGEFLFASERGGPMTAANFRKMLTSVADAAQLGQLKVHPHMLRHAAGFKLGNDGVDTRLLQGYMGHASISNTAQYIALNAGRYKGLWSK
jgi:type 1 fimbriae regulatory protein FimB/type 1 fimbriae regulatory protein FimE